MTEAIPAEEDALLARVRQSLARRVRGQTSDAGKLNADAAPTPVGYDDRLVALRDEIGEARLEDVPQLVAEMERLRQVSLARLDPASMLIDPLSPYFGHLRLRETVRGRGVVERDVLIGRATFFDLDSRVSIVDWRNAPVSQLFYRYAEGDEYEERFGDRDVEGEILVRRILTIDGGILVRIAGPQGLWVRRAGVDAAWETAEAHVYELSGGELTSVQPARRQVVRGVLGASPGGVQSLNRHLPEIAALIDPQQFDVITSRDTGVVVLQGGAGSGKTTVGLHRLGFLSHTFPEKFPPHSLMVVTYGAALSAYIGELLPSLGVTGVRVSTFGDWAEHELRSGLPWLRAKVVDEAAPEVTRVKSHPALLHEVDRLSGAHEGKPSASAILEVWGDLLTDLPRLSKLLTGNVETPLPERDVVEAHRLMVDRVAAVMARDPREHSGERAPARKKKRKLEPSKQPLDEESAIDVGLPRNLGERTVDDQNPEGLRRLEGARAGEEDDQNIRGKTGVDGLRTEDDRALLDLDDVAILLRVKMVVSGVQAPFAHLFVDEAQDLSPMKLSVLIGHTAARTGKPSITLAGDTSQKLFLDNGFGDWASVLRHLGLSHAAVEPLRIAYRSTREILALAREAMGPLADAVAPEARRIGAPIEGFRFPGAGAAVAFLAEALRELSGREPRATVALIARYPEQADRYHQGLARAEVPSLRRVRAQDFGFRPGIEVTDVRQVKGLEFDYVVMLDVNASSYALDDESRHLFHIGVTRAAHQLWLVATGKPSP
ncbi:MAG TPA: ATP-binding domain-containing protein, partial [Polyangiaceae bacterium]|nr:ATP-binding domain-containing protein [Polyangiaceae bacterium]